MFYCEIDERGFCFHTTQNELSLGDNVILSENNEIGKHYANGEWVEIEPMPVDEPIDTEILLCETLSVAEYNSCLLEMMM